VEQQGSVFDRDLNNFRLLFDLRAISLGIIITKSDELSEMFQSMGKEIWNKYGWSTTWMKKLLPRIEGGAGSAVDGPGQVQDDPRRSALAVR
jgi:hypothetical protein